MAAEVPVEDVMQKGPRADETIDRDTVAEQLQQVYEHILDDRRPEAVGATEELARQLGVDVKRPDGFPGRARR